MSLSFSCRAVDSIRFDSIQFELAITPSLLAVFTRQQFHLQEDGQTVEGEAARLAAEQIEEAVLPGGGQTVHRPVEGLKGKAGVAVVAEGAHLPADGVHLQQQQAKVVHFVVVVGGDVRI